MTEPIPMRERILNATAQLLVEHGTQASMSKIAARAEVAAGSLYNHFECKDVLIHAVYERLARQANGFLVDGDTPDAPAPQRLDRYLDNYIEFIWSDPERAILFEYLSNVPLIPARDVIRSFQDTSDFIAGILDDLRADGWLIDGDPLIMGGFIGGAIRNALKWQRIHGRPLAQADRAEIKAMCHRALKRTHGG
tara:strand:- start:578 stop:1159 length:582 start_codon:yes stop_codon:yes gene_type:complete